MANESPEAASRNPLRQRVEDNAFHLKSKVTAFARCGAVKDNTVHLYSRKPALPVVVVAKLPSEKC